MKNKKGAQPSTTISTTRCVESRGVGLPTDVSCVLNAYGSCESVGHGRHLVQFTLDSWHAAEQNILLDTRHLDAYLLTDARGSIIESGYKSERLTANFRSYVPRPSLAERVALSGSFS